MRFTLTKLGDGNYTLHAQATLKRHMYKTTHLTQLPFRDEDAVNSFEKCLLFSLEEDEIDCLDLLTEAKPANPFLENVENLFIRNYKQEDAHGERVLKAWRLRNEYPCELWEIKDRIDNDTDRIYYRVDVKH